MPDVTYYGHWICPYAKRVKFALVHKGIGHDEVVLPPSALRPKDQALPPEFLQHSPRREIPMIRHGAHYLADSIPILRYLEDHFANRPLLPQDAGERKTVMKRVWWLDGNVMINAGRLYYGYKPQHIKSASDALGLALDEAETWLEGRDWLCGKEPSLAEVILIPIYVRLEGLRRLGLGWGGPGRRMSAHLDRCRALPGWEAVAWSPEQEDEFVGRFTKYREIRLRKLDEEAPARESD